jgi:hypothetical protein
MEIFPTGRRGMQLVVGNRADFGNFRESSAPAIAVPTKNQDPTARYHGETKAVNDIEPMSLNQFLQVVF